MHIVVMMLFAGLSRALSSDMATADTSRQGTAVYSPWEMAIEGKTSPKADVYALALIIGEALTGRTFYEGLTLAQAVNAVFYRHLRPELPQWVPSDLRSLLQQSWNENRTLRPSIQEFSDRLGTIRLNLASQKSCRVQNCMYSSVQRGLQCSTKHKQHTVATV